jgi:hypothetical protein
MAHYSEWLPGSREEQLAMAKNWLMVLGEYETPPWGIPLADITELGGLTASADSMLAYAMSAERTHAVTVACKAAFEALVAKMRFFKNHYFLVPPLTPVDLARLGLKERDPGTPIPAPESQPEADLTFPGIHLVELRNIRPVGGPPPDPRGDYGVRIHYGLTGAPTEAHRFRVTEAPKTGKDLPSSRFTRRKKERFDFDGESGNTVYFCLKYENPTGDEGSYGPMLSAVIP